MANKTRIEFEGFEEVIARLSKLEGNIKATTEKALKASHAHITPQLHNIMKAHNQTGATEKSIVDNAKVEWAGSMASIDIGFDISHGGLASIFLMYGTPRMSKDQNLYNAVYGKKTKDEIMKIQEDIFYEEIRRLDK